MQLLISLLIESELRASGADGVHEASRVTREHDRSHLLAANVSEMATQINDKGASTICSFCALLRIELSIAGSNGFLPSIVSKIIPEVKPTCKKVTDPEGGVIHTMAIANRREAMPTLLMLLDFVPNQQRTFEVFLLHLGAALQAKGWRAVLVFSGEPSDVFSAKLEHLNVQYRVFPIPFRAHEFEALIDSLKGISAVAMTTTFISCFNPLALRIKKRLKIRYWLVHDESSGVASPKAGLRLILAKMRGWYYGLHIDRVLAVSEFVAKRNVEQSFLPKNKVKVLRNAVDLSRFHPSADRVESSQDRLAFVGQLIPQKGVRTLLACMTLLKRRAVPLAPLLDIAGEGPLKEELCTYVRENGLGDQVRFLGQVADVAAIYRAATVVIVPSEWAEAAAFVIAEAMSCGACLLVSDAGGNPSLVGPDEEGGRLYRTGDAKDLAEKLAALLSDPGAQQRYRRQARARAERLFALDDMVAGFLAELQKVTSGK